MSLSRYRSSTALWLAPLAATAQILTVGAAIGQETQGTIVLAPVVLDGSGPDVQDGGTGYIAEATATGVKSGAPITEVPQSVSVVTQQEIEDQAPRQLEDAVAYTVGVTSSIWGVDDRFDQFLIRGFDIGTSATFRDGLNQKTLNFTSFKIDPFLIERIDVLRGPAGVLYGENDAGGIVNVITKRPQPEAATLTTLSYGTYNVARMGIDTTGPVKGSETLSYRLVALAQKGEGDVKDSNDDRLLVAPSLTWRPTDDTRVTVMAMWQKDRLTPNDFLPVAGEDYPAQYGGLPESFTNSQHKYNRFDDIQHMLGYEVEHRLTGNVLLRQNFRWIRQHTDYDHVYFDGMADDTTMNFSAFYIDETATQLRLDNQVQYDFKVGSSETTLLGGVDISHDRLEGTMGYYGYYTSQITDPSFDFDIATPPVIVDRTETVDSKAIYAQGVTRFESGLTLTYGGRKAWIEQSYVDHLDNDTETGGKNDAFTKMIGATWDVGRGFVPYASYTEGFTTNIGLDINDDPFGPTKSKQYEIGLRYSPSESTMLTAAVFDIRKDNVLTPGLDPMNPYGQVQVGQIRHKGVEVEARTSMANGLSLVGGYTYLDAEITRSNEGDEGNSPSLVPKHQASLWVDYDFGKTRPKGALSGLSLGGGVRYVGDTWGDNANTRRVDGYTLADLSVRYDLRDYAVQLNVTNVFDKKYAATCDAALGCIYGAERNITLSLDRSF